MGLGTGVTQALQTGNTAAAAQAAQQEAGIKLQNYQAERQNQMQAPGIISSGITTPQPLLSRSGATSQSFAAAGWNHEFVARKRAGFAADARAATQLGQRPGARTFVGSVGIQCARRWQTISLARSTR